MSRLALGTVQFGLAYGISNRGGQVSRAEAKKMLELAQISGIDTLDTAIAYGDSEICLGQAGTQGFKVVTKLPPLPEGCCDIGGWVEQQLDASLARLGRRALYGLLLHQSGQLLRPGGQELWRVMEHLKRRGKVNKLGVSIYSPQELEHISSACDPDLVQAPLNLIDQRLYTTGWLKRLHEDGVEIHTRSAFLQGLLLMPRAAIPSKFLPWSPLWARWHDWLSQRRVTAVEACVAFPLSRPEIDRVVVGAEDCGQLQQIVAAANRPQLLDLPDLCCDAENLIDPSRWAH